VRSAPGCRRSRCASSAPASGCRISWGRSTMFDREAETGPPDARASDADVGASLGGVLRALRSEVPVGAEWRACLGRGCASAAAAARSPAVRSGRSAARESPGRSLASRRRVSAWPSDWDRHGGRAAVGRRGPNPVGCAERGAARGGRQPSRRPVRLRGARGAPGRGRPATSSFGTGPRCDAAVRRWAHLVLDVPLPPGRHTYAYSSTAI